MAKAKRKWIDRDPDERKRKARVYGEAEHLAAGGSWQWLGAEGRTLEGSPYKALYLHRARGAFVTLAKHGPTEDMIDAAMNQGYCDDREQARQIFVAMMKAAIGEEEFRGPE